MVMSTLRFQQQLRQVAWSHEAGFARGLKKAGLFLQGAAQKLTPVDTGALRNSARTESEGEGRNIVVFVIFSTSYAIFVHENTEAGHAVGQAKFLEEPARTRRNEMTVIVFREAHIGHKSRLRKTKPL